MKRLKIEEVEGVELGAEDVADGALLFELCPRCHVLGEPGADGIAEVTFRLPDNLTEWRITARGVTRGTQLGEAGERIVTGSSKVIALTVIAPVPSARPTVILENPSASAAISATVSWSVPAPPPIPTVVAAAVIWRVISWF